MTRRFELAPDRELICRVPGEEGHAITVRQGPWHYHMNATEARALCAALTECGYGAKEPTCKWALNQRYTNERGVDIYRSECDGWLSNKRLDEDGLFGLCECGKRIEVVR